MGWRLKTQRRFLQNLRKWKKKWAVGVFWKAPALYKGDKVIDRELQTVSFSAYIADILLYIAHRLLLNF